MKVPFEVYEGIMAVRDSGVTNMLDRNAVAYYCVDQGFPIAALWINLNRDLYAKGIFEGFEPEPKEGNADV